MVSGISSNLLQNYALYVNNSSSKVTTEQMFQKLSKEMGGDGETITKDDLDAYIEENGDDMDSTKLKALETLQDNWDEISGGEDSIKFDDMAGNTNLLGLIYTSDVLSSINSDSSTSDVSSYLVNSAINSSSSSEDLTSYLTTLLTENSDDNDNSDEIDAVVNLLANQGLLSSSSTKSYLSSLIDTEA